MKSKIKITNNVLQIFASTETFINFNDWAEFWFYSGFG